MYVLIVKETTGPRWHSGAVTIYMTGATVKWIQARAGSLAIDGDFGPKTESRIKELQTTYALGADGIVGADTFTLLTWLNPAPL